MKTIKATPILDWLLHKAKRINLLYGGAGSGKSYQVAIFFIRKFFTEKDITILCLRKTTPALRLTAYKLVLEILEKYFPGKYEHNKTEMIIRHGSNEFIFKGLDIESRIRSMDINYAWLEEASEFTASDWAQVLLRIRKVNDNPGAFNMAVCTTNPISIFSWVYTLLYCNPEVAKNKSLWSDNPFLDPLYIAELLKLQGNYRKIYLDGEFGMMEGLIFPNFEIYDHVFDTISDNSVGIDFGYVHKSSLVKIMFLDSGKFIADELLAESGLTNTQLIDRVKEIIPKSERNISYYGDSAEPARITEFYNEGFNIHMARKSIKDGLDFCIQNLQGVTARSINLIAELRMYSFSKDRMENLMPDPVKVFDDSICAMRYGAYSHAGTMGKGQSCNVWEAFSRGTGRFIRGDRGDC